MSEQEALKLGKALYDNITSNNNNIIPTKDYIKYVAKANEALEKQVAKKPVDVIARSNGKYGKCSSCNCNVLRMPYCERCGQKLDWSDEE